MTRLRAHSRSMVALALVWGSSACLTTSPDEEAVAADADAAAGTAAEVAAVDGPSAEPVVEDVEPPEPSAVAAVEEPSAEPTRPSPVADAPDEARSRRERALELLAKADAAPPVEVSHPGDDEILAALAREARETAAREQKTDRARELLATLDGSGGSLSYTQDDDAAAGAPSPSPTRVAEPVLRGGDGDDAAAADTPTVAEGAAAETEPAAEFVRAGEFSAHLELFHKSTRELVDYVRTTYPEWLEKGHLFPVLDQKRAVIVFTEKPLAEDPVGQRIVEEIEAFDELGLEIQRAVLRPKYIEPKHLMKAMVMAGLANIYEITNEQDVLRWKEGNQDRSVTRDVKSYKQTGMVQGGIAPIAVPPRIPYVYELERSDSFEMPTQYSGQSQSDRVLVTFDESSSTEERGGMMVVGTKQDLDRIQAFADSLDKPARQVMIEIQIISLDANKLSDFGIDSLQFGSGHHIGGVALPLPGENIVQPGLGPDVRRNPEQFVPDTMFEGFDFAFDDTSFDLTGRFLTRLHWLVREGDAKVKARPKILTLDDRTSVLHLGRNEPVFQSTGVTRDTQNGNIVNEIRQVTTQYVGLTLNIRPRITGGAADEVALQMEVIVNELDQRTRVFEEDLAGIPSIIKRHYIGMNRVKNHRPMILGGLIQEQEVENVNKLPLLADIPLLGYLFRRTQKSQSRQEIILVVTPHILSETGVDRAATPKDSIHFDTFDSVLFNDRHILKGSDVIGVDPINKVPATNKEGRVFSEEEVIDLTLLNIIRQRELVSKLEIFSNYLREESSRLNWFQRKWPERNVAAWDEEDRAIYFRAAALVLENIKELNDGLSFEDIVDPRRELLIPTSPYRISLSYDRVKALTELGTAEVFRSDRVPVDETLVELLREGAGVNLRSFAEFLAEKERTAEDHKDLLAELQKLFSSLEPRAKDLASLEYAEVYRELDGANIDFNTLATYFQTNLDERYAIQGPPDVGVFPVDLQAFLRASTSLAQRARRLAELDEKWRRLNSDEEP